MDHVLGDKRVVVFSGMIVNDCGIWPTSTDGIKGKSFVVLLLVSSSVDVQSCLIFVNLVELRSPAPEFSHSKAIDFMASSESLKLLLGSDCSVKVDSFPFDWLLVFDRVVDVKVKVGLLDK